MLTARAGPAIEMENKANKPEGAASGERRLTLPRAFGSELRSMMYGFGDEVNPRADSVRLMEELVLGYISAVVNKATEYAHTCRRDRPDVTDIKFVIRKDKRKLKRVRYLLEMKAELNKATKLDADAIAHGSP